MNFLGDKTMRCSFLFGMVIAIMPTVYAVSASHAMPIGRYLTVAEKPKAEQINLLEQNIQVRFPQNVQTIGDALHYLLRLSGYSLVPTQVMDSAFKTTLTKPLPAIDRDFGPMPLKAALATLAGPAFTLVQDPVNRMVNFKLKPQYVRLYKTYSHKSIK